MDEPRPDPPEHQRLMAEALARLLAAPRFAAGGAQQRLLRHLVAEVLAGRGGAIKESVLGIEVFQRPPQHFDPRRDSIVRVEARRLRQRLREHYEQDRAAQWLIELPKGSYRPRLVQRATGPVAAPVPDSVPASARELVERGNWFIRLGHEEGHRKALERFEAAARAAPDFAAAHQGIARAWMQLVATNLEPPLPGVAIALDAVHRALALDAAHAESLVLAASLTHRFQFDWPAARALFDRALAAAPESAYAHHSLALALMMRADFDAAAQALAHAHRIDPLHLGLRAHQGLLHVYRRQWADAEATLRGLLDMSPDNVLGMSLLAYVMLCRGEAASALAQYRAVSLAHPRLSIGAAGQAWALADLGQAPAARQALQALRTQWQGGWLSPYQLAMAELRLGDADAALAHLQRAFDERDPNTLCLAVDPAFDTLRGDARFLALRRRVLG